MFSTHGPFLIKKKTHPLDTLEQKNKAHVQGRQDIQRTVAWIFGEVFSSINVRIGPWIHHGRSYQHQVEWKWPGTYTLRDIQGVSALQCQVTQQQRNSLRHQSAELGGATSCRGPVQNGHGQSSWEHSHFLPSYRGGADPSLFIW